MIERSGGEKIESRFMARAMMKSHVLRGTKQEIAEGLARIGGVVREAIVFEEEEPDRLCPSRCAL